MMEMEQSNLMLNQILQIDLCIEGNTWRFLRRLQRFDNVLFRYKVNEKLNQKQYAKCCSIGGNSNQYPIPLN